MTLSAMATDYKGNLTVSINGEGSTQPATISIVENAGKYNLSILNFMLGEGESVLPVGNIVIENVTGAVAGNLTTLYVNKNITIQKGNAAGIADDAWLGPMLGEVPVKMSSSFNTNGFLGVNIDIDMVSTLGQVIKVTFENVGNHFQMPNSDFETWSNENNAPKHWHGFESVKGKLSGTAKSKTKLVSSKNVRPGSKGLTSAVVTSTKVFTVIANGTMTNGRLAAGSMWATNSANHSETNLSSTDVDANGDPFATPMYAKPDSVKFWMRFTQAKAQASYPYAAFNAVITDGTYYQDPEDKNSTYNNKVAVAAPNQADMTVSDWRLVSCHFSYATNGAEAKAILLTVSTNATPGKGSYSNGVADSVYVDDLELVYLADIKSVSFKGATLDLANTDIDIADDDVISASDFVVEKIGEDAKVTTLVEANAKGYQAVISVVSGDLNTQKTLVFNFNKPVWADGDVNHDGVVDLADVTLLINKVLGADATQLYNPDVNADGNVDVADVTTLVSLILG